MQYKLNIEKSRNDFQACIEIVGKKTTYPVELGLWALELVAARLGQAVDGGHQLGYLHQPADMFVPSQTQPP